MISNGDGSGMDIAFLLFDRITALDAIGPYEVLSRVPGATVRFVAAEPGPQRTDTGFLTLMADHGLADVPRPDIIVVPGGPGTRDLVDDEAVLEWVMAVHRNSRWTASVCTGALVLGAAGILQGRKATTHWAALDQLSAHGARATSMRIVQEGRIITAAGVSAGIDLGLRLAQLVAGEDIARAIQLIIEYESPSPSDVGSAAAAAPETVALARELLQSGFATPPPTRRVTGEPSP